MQSQIIDATRTNMLDVLEKKHAVHARFEHAPRAMMDDVAAISTRRVSDIDSLADSANHALSQSFAESITPAGAGNHRHFCLFRQLCLDAWSNQRCCELTRDGDTPFVIEMTTFIGVFRSQCGPTNTPNEHAA